MILNRQRRVRVRPAILEEFLARVRRTVGAGDGSVSVCLVSDAAMAQMNRRYRGKRGPTDVLSFPSQGEFSHHGKAAARKVALRKTPLGKRLWPRRSPGGGNFLGDIAVSAETARRNAGRFGRRLEDELRILILHGVLHLLGYDHEADHGEMERLELRLRRKLRIDNP